MKKRILSLLLALTMAAVIVSSEVVMADTQVQINIISASFKYSMAVAKDGSLYTWGKNNYGQLGNGTTEDVHIPTKIMDNIAAINAGGEHSMAITNDGSLYTWGHNNYGQLGNGTTEDVYTPTKIMDNVVEISVGDSYSMAVTKDGSFYTWGHNNYGQLGNGTTEDVYMPTKIMSNVSAISARDSHSMAVTKDGSLYTWGWNGYGQLGNGTKKDAHTPTKIMDNVTSVSAGFGFCMAVTKDGSLYTWGYNDWGQLGDGTTEDGYTPTKIMDNVTSISAGQNHSMAVTTDGSIHIWAWNDNGTEKIIDNIVSVSTGWGHSMAVTTDGSLYTWGINRNGELGIGTTEDVDTPTKVTVSDNVSNSNSSIETEKTADNIYTDSEVDLNFDTSSLDSVIDNESASTLLTSVIANMSADEKASVKAKDQLAYLAEEAAARAATIQVEDDIVINDENVAQVISTVKNTKSSAESILIENDVQIKSVRGKARLVTTKSESVSIKKENVTEDIDVVEAVTPFGSFEFEPSAVSELTVESTGTNKISVNFDKADTTSKVTVKFPNITSDGYKAVVDVDGNVIGGKYNPITDELSAKIDESGVFTVITNEKDFSDIKSQPTEVQNAIKKLASKGVIKGTSETEFSPNSPITRAEIAALIVRILDVDDPNADGGFSDVTKENWYFGSAGSSKRENIIEGYEDNTFRGTVVIPKVQITSVVARTLKNRLGYYNADESILNEFTDSAAIAQWARGNVALATYANMVIRRTDGSFVPNMEMTRGDAAVVLEKLFDKVW